MAEQIDKILKLSEEGKVATQIVPFEAGVLAIQESNFVLLEFKERGLSPVVFIEGLLNLQIVEKPADIERYREAVENLRDSALTPRESIIRMIEVRKSYVGAILARRSAHQFYQRRDDHVDDIAFHGP